MAEYRLLCEENEKLKKENERLVGLVEKMRVAIRRFAYNHEYYRMRLCPSNVSLKDSEKCPNTHCADCWQAALDTANV